MSSRASSNDRDDDEEEVDESKSWRATRSKQCDGSE
jgi:hypothetical protein